MSTNEQLQSENKTLHTDLQALTATISAQGARIAELEEELKTSKEWQEHYQYQVEDLENENESLCEEITEMRDQE